MEKEISAKTDIVVNIKWLFLLLKSAEVTFLVPWHSPKMLCLALSILQLSQLLVAFCCRYKGPFTCLLLWCPLVMTAEISQEQTECLGTTSMFLWMLQWDKDRERQCLTASWVKSNVCPLTYAGFIPASAIVTIFWKEGKEIMVAQYAQLLFRLPGGVE